MARVGAGHVYLELWNGELRRQAMPRLSHGRTAARIAAALTGFEIAAFGGSASKSIGESTRRAT